MALISTSAFPLSRLPYHRKVEEGPSYLSCEEILGVLLEAPMITVVCVQGSVTSCDVIDRGERGSGCTVRGTEERQHRTKTRGLLGCL